MKLHLRFFERFMLTEQDVQAGNLREAQIKREEHTFTAEHHQAMADMYDNRVKRIEAARQCQPGATRDTSQAERRLSVRGVS